MDTLKQLKAEQIVSMKAKNKIRLGTIRLALAAIKQEEIDTRQELSETDVISILTKLVKQRKDSITQYKSAGRPELADIEQNELKILEEFLPQPLSSEEISMFIESALKEVNAESMKDMGKVMAILKPKMQGKADMSKVSSEIKQRLS